MLGTQNTILQKNAEEIHDFLSELQDLLDACQFHPTLPQKAINSRALVFSEIPRLMESIEVLTQGMAKIALNSTDASQQLEATRIVEKVNTILNEILPASKARQI
jgi:hypothetical protein